MVSERKFESDFSAIGQRLDAILHERLRRLLAYWDAERRPDRWLPYDRLRPERIAYVLAEVALLERTVADGQFRFIVRLAGEAIRWEGVGFVRGKTSNEFRPRWFRRHLVDSCRPAFVQGEPAYARVTLRHDGVVYDFERLILPLVRRGPEPDCLLMAAVLPQALIDLKATLNSCRD